jgi:hypothetical protein
VYSEFEGGGADEIADILDDKKVQAVQVELRQGALQHRSIKVARPTRVDLNRRDAKRRDAIRVEGGRDVSVDGPDSELFSQRHDRAGDQARLARSWRGHQVDANDPGVVKPLAVTIRQLIICAEYIFKDRYARRHSRLPLP